MDKIKQQINKLQYVRYIETNNKNNTVGHKTMKKKAKMAKTGEIG